MNRTILMAAALALGAGVAQADTVSEKIEADLESQGYKNIEISQEDGQLKVEAMRGNMTVDLAYDGETGELLNREEDRKTGLERAEQMSGKDLPANRKAGDDMSSDDGDDDKAGDDGRDRGSDNRGNDHGSDNSGQGNNGNGKGRD